MTWFAMHAAPVGTSTSKPKSEPKPKPKPKAKPKPKPIHTEKEQRTRLSSLRKSFPGNANMKMTVQTLIASHFCPSKKKIYDEVPPIVSRPTRTPVTV
jgi:outer membrane biosynthesis protein TonB